MPNLFDGIKKVSEEDLREQIAILETFTMTNLSKQTGQKVAKKLFQATNLVTGLMKKAPLQEPEVLSIEELVERSKLQWQMLGKEELEIHLKNVLKAKCNSLKSGSIAEDISEDALSAFIIEQAAERYELREELLPSQKADLITKCYEDEMKERQKELEKEEEAPETLQIPLGKNKLIRELFVKLIVLSVQAYGGSMVAKDEELPSWIPARERYDKDQAYQDLMKQHSQNDEQYKNVLQSLLDNESDISAKKKLIEYEEDRQQDTKARIEKLTTKKEALLNKLAEQKASLSSESEESFIEQQRLAKEVKMKEAQIHTYESILMMSYEEVEGAKKCIEALTRKKEDEISKELKKALAKRDETAERIQAEKEEREKTLEENWKKIYSQFKFDEECLKAIHNSFVLYELTDVERALLELHNTQDVEALSWGELDKKDYETLGLIPDEHTLHHTMFILSSGETAVLVYQILEEEEDKARIVKIVKYHEE